ncbi:MAG TPA: hypothetical protein VLE45_07190 [Burkholderiaceae bacterium]|nr:hypothetical protein [Burkholderiaceae bacterium]
MHAADPRPVARRSPCGVAHAVAALVALGGCAQSPVEGQWPFEAPRYVSIYASVYEAAAVSAGRFGAMPMRLALPGELEPSPECPAPLAVGDQPLPARCVRHVPSGDLGWVVVSEPLGSRGARPSRPR